ncbi:hypothetical protein ACTWP5_21555 [Streptomyces sp. 4N509B]|uniref:hypothetical protein n=1 Tax=Streptomyces sp. 4N509B TaxID=3457413 RepID=UPI003FD45517
MDIERVRTELDRRGISLRAAARATHYDVGYLSRVLNGKQPASAGLEESLTSLLELKENQLSVPMGETASDHAQSIRQTTQHLVALDNELNGLPIAEAAARSFKRVHRHLGAGDYESTHERDIQAAAAELAEVAGWALFNEGHSFASRRFNQEALFLARLSGDRSTELITLQNMAMVAGLTGRPREELAISQFVLNEGRLSPRVAAVFRAREANGLAFTGQLSEARSAFLHSRSLLNDSDPTDEPSWCWWFDEQEIDRQEGRVFHDLKRWGAAVPLLEGAMNGSGPNVGYKNIAAVRLLDCLLRLKSWKEAMEEAERLLPLVDEMSSVRVLRILEDVADCGQRLNGVPGSLRDALCHIERRIKGDVFEL